MTTRVDDLPAGGMTSPRARLAALADSLPVWAAIAIVFTSNTCIMVLELVASRVMAPTIGMSLYTWTSIIGVILGGIVLGNYLGGVLADRMASRRTLGWVLILAGLLAWSVIPIAGWLTQSGLSTGLPSLLRIVLFTAIVFFLPSVGLGLISPIVIKLTLRNLDTTGHVVGWIYAFSTLGNIIGTFLTGFYLISWFPTNIIVLTVGAVLALVGLLVGRERLLRRAAPALEPVAITDVPDTHTPTAPRTVEADRRLPVVFAMGIVFIANVGIMTLELVASRIIAPVTGSSLYTWTGIIGVNLAGMAVGQWLSGQVADRIASRRTAAWVFVLAGLAALSVIPVAHWVALKGIPLETTLFGQTISLALEWRIVLFTAAIFFIPLVTLGILTPIIVKLTLKDLRTTGQDVGRIYASASAGSIIGTFLTGFWLVSTFGTRAVVIGVGVGLFIMALLVGRERLFRRADAVALVALLGVPLVLLGSEMRKQEVSSPFELFTAFPTYRCMVETNYWCIRWYDQKMGTPEENIRVLVLDHLIHSYNSLESDLNLKYAYERSYADLMEAVPVAGQKRLLVLGGGGYTFPRYVEAKYPGSYVHVVEIDPGVSHVALNYMGLKPDTKIQTSNFDARQYMQANTGEKYNFILGDAFNDFSVPFHLTTLEFARLTYDHLTDDGIYLANVIDTNSAGFLSAYARTINQVFPHVYIIANIPNWRGNTRSTFVIVGSKRDLEPFAKNVGADGRWIPQAEYDQLLRDTPQTLLTDNYVPTDNLLAPVFQASGF